MSKKRGSYSSPLQQKRRQRILREARLQLETHDFSALTMQNIADTSEVSLKTLYNLLGSRDSLLLEAGLDLLDYLEHSPPIVIAAPCIERLLAYTEQAMKGFKATPRYARAVITLLLQAEGDNAAARSQLGRIQQFALACLTDAARQGEIRSDLDLEKFSQMIAANQWGATLMWEKGLTPLEELLEQTRLGHYLVLAPIARGKTKKALEAQLHLLRGQHAGELAPVEA